MLELKNITKTYTPKKGVPVQALRGVDLSFEDRGMVFILGKSGSGKSTLLNIIGGLDSADGGEIIIDGKSTKGFKESDYDNYRNTYVGFVFQEYNILNDFTVGENISLAVELQNGKVSKERVDEILKEVGLEGYADRKPNELSGGQKQRVAIARALIKTPEIIMADEPTGALDSETGRSIFELLKKLSEDKLVVVVSHDREFAEEYGDRIIELSDGEVIADKVNREIKGERKEREDKEIKKARLPYKRALAMGAKSLTKKRLRLAITIILCFVSFAAFGFADVIASRDRVEIGADALYSSKDNYVVFELDKGYKIPQNIYDSISEKTGLSFQNLQKSNYLLPFYDKNGNSYQSKAYYTGIYNEFPASEKLFKEAGFELYGSMPKNENEGVITKYIYEQFALYGINYYIGDEKVSISPHEIGDIQSFIAKNVRLSNLQIVGVVDTHVDPNGNLEWLKNLNKDEIPSNLEQDYEYMVDKYFNLSYHTMLFMYAPYYEEIYPIGQHDSFPTKFGKELSGGITNLWSFEGVSPESSFQYTDKIIWLDGKGNRKELANNEIVIGSKLATYLWPRQSYEIEEDILCGYTKTHIEGIVSFDRVNYNQFKSYGAFFIACCKEAEKISLDELEIFRQYCIDLGESFNHIPLNIEIHNEPYDNINQNPNEMTERELRLSYACYLAEDRDENGGYYTNITGRMSGNIIKNKYEGEVFVENRLENDPEAMQNVLAEDDYVYFNGSESLNDELDINEPIKVVGVYISQEGYPDDYVINDKIYEQGQYYENGIYDYIIAPLPHDKDIINLISDMHYNLEYNHVKIAAANIAFQSVSPLQNAMNTLRPYVACGSGILGVFCLLLLSNYIGISISSKKKEIGILRAMCAKRRDIIAVFINEGIILTAIILGLAIIGVIGICLSINSLLPKIYGIVFSFLKIGIRQIILMVLVGSGATLLASAIPLYKMAKKKPVDIIQNK